LAAYRHPVAIVGETHSAGAVCTSQLNYLNIAKMKHASILCRVQMHGFSVKFLLSGGL